MAPVTLIEMLSPMHISLNIGLALMIGSGLTVMKVESAVVQPNAVLQTMECQLEVNATMD